MKEVELYEFVDKRINSFEYNDIFIDSEISGVWGVKQNSCKSISFDTLNNFIGKDHLHIKWNEEQEIANTLVLVLNGRILKAKIYFLLLMNQQFNL